jgi:nitrite transporter NirC
LEEKGLSLVAASATKKVAYSKNIPQYFIYSAMAGACCALGMALAYSVGSSFYFNSATTGMYSLIMGITFALSFTLIVFSGAELFTGNMMTMTIGTLTRSITIKQALTLSVFCYFANICGAIFFGWLFGATGLLEGKVGQFLVTSCEKKMALPFSQALTRGILCNMLICMGTWATIKLKSEAAQMIVLVWVVLGFVATGYEHSIANTALFTMSFLAPQTTSSISLAGAFSNLLPVTLGNIIGGSLFVGFVYWYSGRSLKS